MGAAVIACSVRYGLTPNLYSEQELRPTETSRGDSEKLFSESPRDREKLMFLKISSRVLRGFLIISMLEKAVTGSLHKLQNRV